VADIRGYTIRKITPSGVVTTLAGTSRRAGQADGIGNTAQFWGPAGIAMDGAGNLFVADSSNNTIRKGMPVIAGPAPAAPLITASVASQSVTAGGIAVLAVNATANPAPTYQWQYNGIPIPGATNSTLPLTNIGTAQAGDYSVVVTSGAGTAESNVATVSVTMDAWLTNLSARAFVAPALNPAAVLIAGFVTTGPDEKSVLARGVGPGMQQFGLTDFLSNPSLTITAGSSSGPTMTGWNPDLASVFNGLGAFPFAAGSQDTAVVETLTPGPYTAVVSSADKKQSGIALVELYDADTGAPANRLINLSTRAFVGTGADILIGGFVISGTSSETVLIRAVGPGLAAFDVPGTLNEPQLQLYDNNPERLSAGQQIIASITGWGSFPISGPSPVTAGLQPATAEIMAKVGAFGLAPSSLDAAMVVTLPPGAYTVQVQDAAGSTGVALFEIYEIP
jgi:Immunoglobulin domain/NHL repeat